MSYKPDFSEGAVAVPEAAIDACGDLLQFRLLCLICSDRTMCEADDSVIAERLLCSADEVRAAAEALRAAELIKPERKLSPSAQSKNLTGEEIAEIIEGDEGFRGFIDECENICGKVFTPTDTSKIASLRKYLGFDGETIVLMFFYYAEKLDAVQKKLSVSYVEKAAYSLYNQGIRTYAQLQEYITQDKYRNSIKFKLRRLFGTGDREFTKKEQKFFDKWSFEWNMPFELIEYAFEEAVNQTGKPAIDYMSKILSSLHDEGITSVEEAEKRSKDNKSVARNSRYYSANKKTDKNKTSSFDSSEFFEDALRRSEEMLNNFERKD